MKQVFLLFKDIELGFLTEENGAYVWVPNPAGLQVFATQYSAACDLFFLNPAQPQVYNEIPAHFSDYLESAGRADLAKKANILPNDSDFDKLCKLATLTYFAQDFVIKV